MKIAAVTLLITFVGFPHSDCTASKNFIEVEMTDGLIFRGEVHQVNKDPDWLKPRPLPHEGYRGYEVFIRMWHNTLYASDFLIPTTVLPINRNPAHNPPMRVKLTLGNDILTNTKYYQLYNPNMKKSYNGNRMFITIADTVLIYHAKLQLHWNLDITAHAVQPSRISARRIYGLRGSPGQRGGACSGKCSLTHDATHALQPSTMGYVH